MLLIIWRVLKSKMKNKDWIKKHVLKYHGQKMANRIYNEATSEEFKGEHLGKTMKGIIKENIDYLYAISSKKQFNLVVDGMYEKFGEMGEFLPQLYILNITKPRDIKEKKKDLWKTIMEIKE